MATINYIAGYIQTDEDQSAASPQYFGYLQGNGTWYIMQMSTNGNVIQYRYFAGSGLTGTTGYQTNWGNRASLTYDYYSNIFLNT